jgi:hypothetical protein
MVKDTIYRGQGRVGRFTFDDANTKLLFLYDSSTTKKAFEPEGFYYFEIGIATAIERK